MWTEAQVREAAINWRAAHAALRAVGDWKGALVAEGYADALEMVLRPEPVAR